MTTNLSSRPGRAAPAVIRLAVARGASILGREAAAIAVLSEVYGRTHSAAWVAGTLLLCEGVYALASVPAGGHADRLDRRRLMLISDLAGVALALLVATLPATPVLILLAGVAMIVEAPF